MAFVATLVALIIMTVVVARRTRPPGQPVRFANPRREALLSLIPTAVVFAFTSVVFLLVASRDGRPATLAADRADTYTSRDAAGQLAANGIILMPIAGMLTLRRQHLETVGITRRNLAPSLVIGGAASVAAVALNGRMNSAFWLRQDTLWLLAAQFGVGISEEVIFRGYLQLRWTAWLRRSGWLAVAAICTLWHVPAAIESNGVGTPGGDLAMVMAAALTFGWCMKATENIAGLSVVHAVLNVVSDA